MVQIHRINKHVRYFKFESPSKTINHYKIADTVYQTCVGFDELSSIYHKQLVTKPLKNIQATAFLDINNNTYHDIAHIGEKEYHLNVDIMSDGSYQLQSDDEKYSVNKNTLNVLQTDIDKEILLGPVLILNLALNNVFCLHSSAFILNDKVFIFMGDSGTGKSTVANYMNDQDNCLRLSDDILPLKISNNSLMLLPHFPQLKLPRNQQYQGKDIVKETILLFAKKSKSKTDIEPIDRFSANKKLIQHSVATKLFARKELKNHMSFCHETCSLTRSFQLNYQHSPNSLEKLFTLLNEIV